MKSYRWENDGETDVCRRCLYEAEKAAKAAKPRGPCLSVTNTQGVTGWVEVAQLCGVRKARKALAPGRFLLRFDCGGDVEIDADELRRVLKEINR